MSQALETPASEALPKTPRLLQPSGELSYALPSDSRAMSAVIKVIERLTGSKKIHRLYQRWRVEKYGDRSKLIYRLCTDPGGGIPLWIVKMANQRVLPQMLLDLETYASRNIK